MMQKRFEAKGYGNFILIKENKENKVIAIIDTINNVLFINAFRNPITLDNEVVFDITPPFNERPIEPVEESIEQIDPAIPFLHVHKRYYWETGIESDVYSTIYEILGDLHLTEIHNVIILVEREVARDLMFTDLSNTKMNIFFATPHIIHNKWKTFNVYLPDEAELS